jgi:hypothetical protein
MFECIDCGATFEGDPACTDALRLTLSDAGGSMTIDFNFCRSCSEHRPRAEKARQLDMAQLFQKRVPAFRTVLMLPPLSPTLWTAGKV